MENLIPGTIADPATGRQIEDPTFERSVAALGDNPFKAVVPGGIEGNRVVRGARKMSRDEQWTAMHRRNQEATFKYSGVAEPCVVVNFNPFPLSVNGGLLFSTQIPECPAGKPYVYIVLDQTKWTTQDQGAGLDNIMHFYPWPTHPAEQACEYVREYTEAQEQGGVLTFFGNRVPEDLDVEVWMPVARTTEDEMATNRIERVRVNLKEKWDQALAYRNKSMLRRLQTAISNYSNDQKRHLVNDNDRADAHAAQAIGLIPKLPGFCMEVTLVDEAPARPCPACGAVPQNASVLLCKACNSYVFDIVGAYKHGLIEFGHVSMDRASEEELEELIAIRDERAKIRSKFAKKLKKEEGA